MHSEEKQTKVIYYGAGSYLAKHLKHLSGMGYVPLCVCDRDSSKWNKPFCGCADLQVLPLETALERYPGTGIYVTVDHTALGNVLHDLTDNQGIHKEQIINYLPIEYRLGCPELETSIKFRTKRIFVRCYWRHPGIDRGDNIERDIRRFDQWRTETINAIRQGKSSPCDGCECLRMGWYPTERNLINLQLSDSNEHSYCNFNCIYCFVHARNKQTVEILPEQDEQLNVLRHLAEYLPDQRLELQFSTGELTVHPNRDEILDHFRHYETTLFTNAGIYNEKIAQLMEQGLLSLVVSMDSGTAETFYKIKNMDVYHEVCDNLTRYAQTGGCIVLKYIMLPGINDNFVDADGFIDLAVRLGAVVQISNDTRTRCAPLPESGRATVCRIAGQARGHDLLVIHEREVFSHQDNTAIAEAMRKIHEAT